MEGKYYEEYFEEDVKMQNNFCIICDKYFKSNSVLRKHVQSQHFHFYFC